MDCHLPDQIYVKARWRQMSTGTAMLIIMRPMFLDRGIDNIIPNKVYILMICCR